MKIIRWLSSLAIAAVVIGMIVVGLAVGAAILTVLGIAFVIMALAYLIMDYWSFVKK